MRGTRVYPDEPAGPFPTPPVSFTDRDDREVAVRAYEDDDYEGVVEMYVDFDPGDRAQGIPPSNERRVRDWLDTLVEEGINVAAWHGDRVAGHATLVPDGPSEEEAEAYELAIFVLQEYQRAGIGSHLLRTLLGLGKERGVEKVWLTVERWNHAAVALYEKVGFETSGTESFELEMALRLA